MTELRWKFQRDAARKPRARRRRSSATQVVVAREDARNQKTSAWRSRVAASLADQIDALRSVDQTLRVTCPWRLDDPRPCPLGRLCPCGGVGWWTAGGLADHHAATLAALRST